MSRLVGVISLGIVVALGAAACGTSVQHGASSSGANKSKVAKIAIVPAGPHPYFAPMPKGIKQAKGDFNLTNITYQVPATWSLSDQNKTIESLVSQGYNAFAMFPGDANGSNATISELASHGIPTVTVGGCTRSPTKAKFCLATDVKKEAYQAAKELIKAIGGKGKIVHFTSNLTDPNTKPREQGVAKAVGETHGKVKLVQTIAGTDSPDKAGPAVRSLLAARGNKIDGIMSTAYTDSVALAKELMQSNPHHIKVIGIDADPTVIKGIKEGAVTATIDQNPYGQAYIAAYALNQMVSHGCRMKDKSSPHIASGTVVVTKRNADHYLDDLRVLTKKMQSTFEQKYLTCPSS